MQEHQENSDVLTEAVRILRQQRDRGRELVYLETANCQQLFAGQEKQAASRPLPTGSVRQVQSQPSRPVPQSAPPAPPAASPRVAPARQPLSPPPAPKAESPQVGAEVIAGLDWAPLEAMVRDCRRCPLCEQRNLTVFGEGSHQARLMFIGEGPGADEDRQGRPFVGRAGQLLTKMIQAMKFTREEVYIGNIVKCRPPRNRVPEKEEAAACLPYLNRQIKLINPEVLVLLGATPLQYLLNLKGINRQHGQWHEYLGIPTLPTFHPAYLLRSPNKKREAWADLQKVMARLRRAEG